MAAVSRLTRWLGAAPAAAGPVDDWRLWREAAAGDARSARALVQVLAPNALRLARAMLGADEDAEDAVQDAFLRLWRSTAADTGSARLSTYFNTIVLNRCRTVLGTRREQPTDDDTLAELLGADAAAPAAPDARATDGLHAALAGLPVRQRMAIVMWAYADASAADIARTLDVDANAAHQLLHRARRALKLTLQGGGT